MASDLREAVSRAIFERNFPGETPSDMSVLSAYEPDADAAIAAVLDHLEADITGHIRSAKGVIETRNLVSTIHWLRSFLPEAGQ